jgi:hypothetical protein
VFCTRCFRQQFSLRENIQIGLFGRQGNQYSKELFLTQRKVFTVVFTTIAG